MPHVTAPSMRILQIVISPDPGGVLALSQSVGTGLAAQGYAVETAFVVTHPKATYAARLKGAFRLAWRIITGRYDALIAYQPSTSILVGVMGALTGTSRRIAHQTTVPDENSWPIRMLDRIIGSLRVYRHNIVNTVHTREQYRNYPRAYRSQVVMIEHGMAVPQPGRSRAETLARHNIPDNGLIVLNTARLAVEKNHQVLLRALVQVPDGRLIVAGEGALRPEIEELVMQLGLQDRVHLLGAVTHGEALDLYGAADVFAFPSRHETFGISAVEAAMSGLPVIASDIPVLREVLQTNGQTAVRFAPPDAVTAWEAELQDVMAKPADREVLQLFGKALAAKYSEERMLQGYLALLRGDNLPAAFAQKVEVAG